MAVMGFAVTELDDAVRERLSDATVLGVDKLKLFDVISGDDVQAMLDQQQLKDALVRDRYRVPGRAWRRLGRSLHDQRQSE